MSRKKICFFTPVSLASVGGGERVLCVIANELAKSCEVHIVSYNMETSFYFLASNIRLESLGLKRSKNSFFRKMQPFFYMLKFRSYVKRQQFDEIIVLSEIGCFFVSIALCFLRVKKIAWLHNSFFEPQPLVIRLFRKYVLMLYDKIVVINRKDEYIYRDNQNLVNTIRIPNPLTLQSSVKSSLNCKRIISVGRLNRQKGFDFLITACLPVLREYPDWRLDIFGQDDGAQHDLQCLIEECSCTAQVAIHPPTCEIMQEYLQSSVFAFTSLFESFGLVLLEAAEAGLPLIAFDSPSGIADIVENNSNGFLIEKGNIDDFTSHLRILVENKEMREKFANGAIQKACNFNIEKIIKSWYEIL